MHCLGRSQEADRLASAVGRAMSERAGEHSFGQELKAFVNSSKEFVVRNDDATVHARFMTHHHLLANFHLIGYCLFFTDAQCARPHTAH